MPVQANPSDAPIEFWIAWLDTCYPERRSRAAMERIVQDAMRFLRDELLEAYGRNTIEDSVLVICSDFHTSHTESHHHWTGRLHRNDGFYLGGLHLFHPLNPYRTPQFQDRALDNQNSFWVQEGLHHYTDRLRFLD